MSGGTLAEVRPVESVPLCVDLDGTLIATDVLVESAVRLLQRNPFYLFLLPVWLLRGRARLKQELAARVAIDAAALPYNEALVGWLRQEHAAGRRLVLATAADEAPAQAVAAHLGLFEEVLASDGTTNLKGDLKRDSLVARFGERKFDYAGNERSDLPVWRSAREAVVVAAPTGVLKSARALGRVAHVVPSEPVRPATLLRAIRVHQWLKNLLVFVPAFTAHRLFEPAIFGRSLLAFVAFSLCASAVYLLNDLVDLDADRRHRTKRDRPFASGAIPILWGAGAIPVLLVASALAALPLDARFAQLLLLYFASTTLYSFVLKKEVVVDVLCLAGLYTLRIFAGASAVGVPISPWLLAFSMFLFLSLAVVKRVSELRAAKEGGAQKLPGRGYSGQDVDLLTQMGISAGYLAVLVFALYINLGEPPELYRNPRALWLLCPLIFYWVSRIWILTGRGLMHDDPVVFAVRDRTSYVLGVCAIAIILLAR